MQTLKKTGLLKDESRAYQWRAKFLEYRFQGTPRSRLANIDIYHSNYHTIPAVVQCHQRIKAVLTVHDIIPILHPEWCGMLGAEKQKYFHPEFNLPATLNALTQDNWIICPSNASRNDLCDYLKRQIDPDKVQVIPWAASPTVFYPCLDLERRAAMRLKYKIPAGHYLLSLSTIEPRKNLDGLIRSFHRLLQQERMSDLYLVLAGALGWDYQGIFQALRKYPKLAGRVIFTGHIVNEDMAALYSDALGFVCPSFYEGFGLPPLEAMQCGTPVIVSDVSSLPEVVGDAGLLVNPRDEEAIAQAMLKLYRDAALRAELSQKGLARSAMFSWSQCAEQTADFYRRALAS